MLIECYLKFYTVASPWMALSFPIVRRRQSFYVFQDVVFAVYLIAYAYGVLSESQHRVVCNPKDQRVVYRRDQNVVNEISNLTAFVQVVDIVTDDFFVQSSN